MINKLIKVVGCVLLIVVLAVGCRPAERPVPQDPVPPQRQVAPNQRVEDPTNIRQGDTMGGQELSIRAEQIVNAVVRLDEVKSATVVISDETALVGVNLVENVRGEMTTEVKRKIEDAVKSTDREIERVAVSADPDIFDRVENIARETGRGRPLSGFGREIEDLIRRIIPNA